jgi:alpha-galactosidase
MRINFLSSWSRVFLRGAYCVCVCAAANSALSVTPTTGELLAAKAWASRTFAAGTNTVPIPHLELVYQDAPDGVGRGRSWRGTPYQLGDKTYAHGLSFNSTKHLRVIVGKPLRRFVADVGLENNDDTVRGEAMGQGSVVFHVLAGGKELFTSPVLRRKDEPKPVDVDLGGVTEFEIRVTDAGDGRGWDQALWGAGEITLEDGTRLRLQDLPLGDVATRPFAISFQYGGTNSADLLARWPMRVSGESVETNAVRRHFAWDDAATGLGVRIDMVEYLDFPAVEWVAYFTNASQAKTPILASIEAFDGMLPLVAPSVPVLHWNTGGVASFDDFAPRLRALEPGTKLRLQPGGGRSSSQVLPFFNIEGADAGVIAAIGWSGEWAADFEVDARQMVSLKTGMARTHLALLPGESIRTPRMCVLFYQGDAARGQNLWRQFVLAHHRPLRDGQPLIAPITCGNWGGTTAEVHLDNIRQIAEQRLPLDYYWIDAEWFGKGGWADNVGNWAVKTNVYPRGFKPLSDALRASGRELMLWFEPERVYKGTPWQVEHPNWMLGNGGDNFLLNLGNPEARKFLTDFIAARVEEYGLGCYRQDFNIDPLAFWQAADAPDRQGATEIHYIEGLYAFWDGLLARFPHLIIDNCASGGRRLDLETLGRATPFWRTDGPRDAIAHQCHTHGLLNWVPLSATSVDRPGDNYEFRSGMCSALCLNWWIPGDGPADKIPATFPFAWARETLEQYVKVRPFYYGDYYPLTSYSQSRDLWLAYQLTRPGGGAGMVVALRRPESPYRSAQFQLRDLEPDANYKLTNLDSNQEWVKSGRELLTDGLGVELNTRPGSALITYERQ